MRPRGLHQRREERLPHHLPREAQCKSHRRRSHPRACPAIGHQNLVCGLEDVIWDMLSCTGGSLLVPASRAALRLFGIAESVLAGLAGLALDGEPDAPIRPHIPVLVLTL